MTARQWSSVLTLFTLTCACSGNERGCEKTEDCEEGKVCIVRVEGEKGVCAVPGYSVALIAPAAGTKVNASGVDVKVEVQLAGPEGQPPSHVRAKTRGGTSETCELTLSGRDGALLTYQGRCLAQTRYIGSVMLWAEAETSAGALMTDAVLLALDGVRPSFPRGGGTVACPHVPPCVRDEDVEVSIYVDEDDLDFIEATLDLEGSMTTVPLRPTGEVFPGSGQRYAANVPLEELPFPRFSGSLAVRIVASDLAGNETAVDVDPIPVTRMRWVKDLRTQGESPVALTGPAISGSEIVVGKADGKLHFVTSEGAEREHVAISTDHAPSVGPTTGTVWVGSEDGNLYGLKTDGSMVRCPATPTMASLYTPMISSSGIAYTGGTAERLYRAADDGTCSVSPTTGEAVTTALVESGGMIYAATATATATATARRYDPIDFTQKGAVTPRDGSIPCSNSITAPPAVDASGNVIVACGNGQLHRIESVDADTLRYVHLKTLEGAATESIVVLPTATGPGDLIVGTNDGKLQRLGPPASGSGWAVVWTIDMRGDTSASVTGSLIAAAASDGKGPVVYAVTSGGDLHALDAAGVTVWSTAGESSRPLGNAALTFPTIAPAPPAHPGRLPTLYVGSGEGKLYAVVVDTDLDTSSPWPKSHRDIQNTSNADLPRP